MLYLAKANDELISHCRCETALVAASGQLDCPWCGCGWLFSCLDCRMSFTFAEPVEVDLTMEELAVRDLRRRLGERPDLSDVRGWAEEMREVMSRIESGRRYVYLDGGVWAADVRDLRFLGWHSIHELPVLPHREALEDRSVLDRTVADARWWFRRRRPGR